ncbi:MAG: hypothetical protein H7068_11210 [Pedobacter sp.]|nr:hypothetical protein [Chitinophagaceae bacterium]
MNSLSLNTNVDFQLNYSHMIIQELTEPLSYINLSVELLKSNIEDEQQREFLEVINHNVIRINNFVNSHLLNNNAIIK